jgi:hypothetical protein
LEKEPEGLKKGYWEGRKNEPIALIGSGGLLRFRFEGNAKALKIGRGDPIIGIAIQE